MKIAVMPGDGVGKEVVPAGLTVLKQAARKFGFRYSTTDYPFGGEHYLKTGQTLPDSALKELAAHDAILFGAVGVDPRGSAQIPQGILETEILLKMRFELDQYVNLRPTRLLPGVPTPLKDAGPDDINMVIVRENTEGLYCGNGGFLYKNTPARSGQSDRSDHPPRRRALHPLCVRICQAIRPQEGDAGGQDQCAAIRAQSLAPRVRGSQRRIIPASKPIIITSMPARCTW